jgi:nucleoid-associated protein YgaU
MANKTNNNLKKILKAIKLNESSISFVLGLIVVLIVGSLIINYLKSDRSNIPDELLSGVNSIESANKTHKVEKGENLWNIAVSYYGDGFKWVDIATENKLANASEIEVGQELIIPDIELEKIVVSDEVNTTDSIVTDTYTVQKGDSLWTIAVRSYGDGYQWTKIASANNITHPNVIHAGNVLSLPR